MADNNNREELKNQGWKDMSALLDIHMPEEKSRPIIGWYWLAAAAVLLLALVIPLSLLKDRESVDHSQFASKDQVLETEKQNSSISGDIMEANSTPSKEIIITDGGSVQEDLAKSKTSFTPTKEGLTIRSKGYENKVVSEGERPDTNGRYTFSDEKLKRKTPYANEEVADNIQAIENQEVGNLRSLAFEIEKPDILLNYSTAVIPERIEVPESTSKIKATLFSDIMWSLSDRFGFVNAGPSGQYKLGDWTVGMSGGIAVPLPRQKAFYASNLPFSEQYNFNSSIMKSNELDFSSNAGSVYYESYSMNPGLVFVLSTQRQLSNQWSVGLDLGRIGFRYDFTQKAEPNQSIAANTELNNLQNKLWYGGLSLHYHLGEHWVVKGGVRFINLLNTGEVGALPAFRLEYGF